MAKKTANVPAISVITALYNTEAYIGQCLESLLAQTFQDFEVIVVDDCSTDKSAAIVAEIAPKFEGRLKLIRLKKNSGFPGLPRNTAMNGAKGKYIAFLDSDDFYKPDALEKFYNTAEETDAEVIHAEKYFSFDEEGNDKGIITFQKAPFVTEPTLEPEDIGERIKRFVSYQTLWWGINKLFRRDFLVKNHIQFPNITAWEDLVLIFHALMRAQKYVRVPDVVYCYRLRKNSLSHKGRDAHEMTSNLIGSMKAMDRVMEKTDFLVQNPQFRYMFVDWYVQGRLRTICDGIYNFDKLHPFQVMDEYRRKFLSVNTADQIALYSYFFTMTTFNKMLIQAKDKVIIDLRNKVAELEKQVQQLQQPAENTVDGGTIIIPPEKS